MTIRDKETDIIVNRLRHIRSAEFTEAGLRRSTGLYCANEDLG